VKGFGTMLKMDVKSATTVNVKKPIDLVCIIGLHDYGEQKVGKYTYQKSFECLLCGILHPEATVTYGENTGR